MQNLTIQKIILALVTVCFFVAAPWLTSETLSGNSLPLISILGVGLLLLFVYGLGDRCWLIIPFCLSIEGNLNFLPLNFSIQELATLAVLSYLLFRMIFGLDVAWRPGPAQFWIPLLGVLGVLLYHWISSGDIGIKLLGGSGWGGRKYFKVFIGTLSIPLLASFPAMRWQDLQKVPLVYFMGTFVDIVPDLLTTLIPATAPLVWKVYSGVNLSEYGDSLKGNFLGEKAVTRFGALAKLGTALGLATLCYFPARAWLQPSRLWVMPALLLGGIACAISGFRNMIFRYAISLTAGLFAMIRFKALLLLPCIAACALAVALTQGRLFEYPAQIQRSLSFLPGDWNVLATADANASSQWREKMKALFYKEYFDKAPLLGQGYHFDPNLAKQATDIYLSVIQARATAGDEYAEVRNFIEMRQPHEGTLHILLVSGVVGSVFFVSYCLSLLVYSFASVLRTPPQSVTPIQIWAVAMLLSHVLGFFLVFGDLSSFVIQVIPVSMLLYRFQRLQAVSSAPLKDPLTAEPEPIWPRPIAAGSLPTPPAP